MADRPERGYVGSGALWIDGVGLFKPIEKSHVLAIETSGARLGRVYLPGETIRIRAKGEGDGIRWQICDYFGRTIANGQGAAEETLISRTSPEQGYFECRIELVRGGRDADARLFSWAVLPHAAQRNPFVGMGCHFRGAAYPLECMDLLARYGLTEFRDEIPWSSVEQEPGRYALPPDGAEFVARAEKLGLNPLLILDYGNRLYDDGGFPNSSAAVAAYAEYSAAMARMLRGKVRDFEVWNEWTIGCGMRGRPGENSPERYGRLLRAAYRAIHASGGGEVTVVGLGGEHSGHHFEQIRGMVRSAGAGSMDAYSVHGYRYPRAPEETDLVGEIRTVAAMVEAEGGPARLWVTEIGWPTHADERGVDERTQALPGPHPGPAAVDRSRGEGVLVRLQKRRSRHAIQRGQFRPDSPPEARSRPETRGGGRGRVFTLDRGGGAARGLAARRGLGRAPRCARRPTGDRLGHRPRPGDQAPTGRCRGLRHDGQPAGRPGGAGTDGRPALRCGAGLVGLVSSKRPAALNTGESTALGNAGCSERLQHAPQTGISACPPGDGSLRDVFDPSSDRGCRDCHGAPENRPVGGAGLGGEFPAVGAGSTDTRIAVSGALPE